jgi:hypothetical protein
MAVELQFYLKGPFMAAKILVTGDVVLDVNIYKGGRMTPDSGEVGTCAIKTSGGATIAHSLLSRLAGKKPDPRAEGAAFEAADVVFGIQEPANWPEGFRASTLWEAVEIEAGKKKERRWFPAKPQLGYGTAEASTAASGYPATPVDGLNKVLPRIVVIDDGMLGFRKRTAEACWPEFLAKGPDEARGVEWVVLKMASPLGHGDLWHTLSGKWKDKLILIVNAADLRRADVRLTRGLSWDQTAEDIVAELEEDSALRSLCACRHLVVTLASEGAVWLSNPGDSAARRGTLVFEPGRAEGEFDEESGRLAPYGSLSAMTASVVWRLWFGEQELDLVPALKAGLSAARVLRECGHGQAEKGSPQSGFPWDEVIHELSTPIVTMNTGGDGKPTDVVEKMVMARHTYSSVALPMATPGPDAAGTAAEARSDLWTILKANTESALIRKYWPKDKKLPPLSGTGRRLALYGPGSLSGVPYARFGKLLTMDRGDIESLRSIRQLMLRYKAEERPKTPLSIAVFGAPGSGKSFGLKQIAEAIFHDKPIEFNLSQFKGPEELYGAYHQIRDRVLAGATPVVFWDEFDSRELMWLQYLLAPMQDGVFQEGPFTHSIGKCVFVFAGGTSYDYRYFGPLEPPAEKEDDEMKKARREFVQKKGPDFKSRLTTCLNVLGPNPRKLFDRKLAEAGRDPWVDDPADVEFPVRRAILLRGLLKYDPAKELKIDPGLLTALLEVGHYRNGARSMEKLIGQIVADGSTVPSRAGLPHREIVAMLVEEVDEFYDRLHATGFGPEIEALAEKIHERYRQKNKEEREKDPATPILDPNSDVPWAELPPDLKASNRAAAQRISQILAAVGLTVVPGKASKEESEAVSTILKSNLEMLARMEHDGWMDEKKRQGWTRGEKRDDKLQIHPLLVAYDDLPLHEKEKDRDSILEYPKRVAEAGYKIAYKNPELWPCPQQEN